MEKKKSQLNVKKCNNFHIVASLHEEQSGRFVVKWVGLN